MQLEAIASRPITSYLGDETNTHLTTTSFQVLHFHNYKDSLLTRVKYA